MTGYHLADRWPPDEAGHISAIGIVGLFFLASFVALALYAALSAHDRLERTPENCARKLGIAYTIEHGATERLDAFADCTGDERYR